MDKKKKSLLLTALALCVSAVVLVAFLKGRNNKVQNTTENHEASEKEETISGLRQELSDIRISDDSFPDMSEVEISSAVDLLHENGMQYEDITVYDLRHANDVIPIVKVYSDEELDGLTEIELARTGVTAILEENPKSTLVFWALPEKTNNGYNISIDADTELIEPRYLYDWDYAKINYIHDLDYLSRDEKQLYRNIGRPYSELLTDFNTYTAYHGLNANEYLSPGEKGRFVLLRWFKFKGSDKEGWAVCYVDVVNDSDEKRTKRDCPMTQVLFTI